MRYCVECGAHLFPDEDERCDWCEDNSDEHWLTEYDDEDDYDE